MKNQRRRVAEDKRMKAQPKAEKSDGIMDKTEGSDRRDNDVFRKGRFCVKRPNELQTDLNPIIDEVAPTSTGRIFNASRLANMLGITFHVTAIDRPYMHGCGDTCENAKPLEYIWTLTVNDVRCNSTTFIFDLVQGESPLIIGLNHTKNSDTINRSSLTRLCFQRPSDTAESVFYTHISQDRSGFERLRLKIVQRQQLSSALILGIIKKRPAINIVKKVHRLKHGTANEMRKIFSDAGLDTPDVRRACEVVFNACELCVLSGRPDERAKISLTNVNTAVNDEVQAGFVTAYIRDEKYKVLNIVDMGTKYGERSIAPDKDGTTMMSMLESTWLYRHGAPTNFSADQ